MSGEIDKALVDYFLASGGLQKALDDAVLAHRANPTRETLEALRGAMEAYTEDFYRREREEALARQIEEKR